MIFGTFHKTGTYIFKETLRVYKLIAGERSVPFEYSFYDDMHHAPVEEMLKNNSVCMIRHPLEVIMSGMRYHQTSDEPWLTELGGGWTVSYQENLNALESTDDKIIFETINCGANTIKAMFRVSKSYNKCLMLKIEDFVSHSQNDVLQRMAHHANLNHEILSEAVTRVLGWDDFGHMTHGNACDHTYREAFKSFHYTVANSLFPLELILSRLGYKI